MYSKNDRRSFILSNFFNLIAGRGFAEKFFKFVSCEKSFLCAYILDDIHRIYRSANKSFRQRKALLEHRDDSG